MEGEPEPGGAHLPGHRDALVATFREGKCSVAEWDLARHRLRVTSLHSWEGDTDLQEGRTTHPDPPRAFSDPQGRCAAVLMYGNKLAVLPAAQDDKALMAVAAHRQKREAAELYAMPGKPGAIATPHAAHNR